MPVYYEVINGTIYVCNRNHLVRQPVAMHLVGLGKHQLDELCDTLNATYRAGYQTALNQVRAKLDQMETADHGKSKSLS